MPARGPTWMIARVELRLHALLGLAYALRVDHTRARVRTRTQQTTCLLHDFSQSRFIHGAQGGVGATREV